MTHYQASTPDVVLTPIGAKPAAAGAKLAWDQRETLMPPPYTRSYKHQLAGLYVGDPLVDALPMSAVTCHGGERRKLDLGPDPEWVDWESVERGQKVWMNRLGQFNVGLTLALLQGFSIARFAVVLYTSGYAQSAETSYDRYRETMFAIIDWMRHSLKDRSSKAHAALSNVRAMHSFARRRSQRYFGPSDGVALSQHDMAEVLMAFASVAPLIAEREMKATPLTYREKRDLCHTWRLIGHFLGIQDQFNVCSSIDWMNELTEEWLEWVPMRLQTCRKETFELQKAAIAGFGQFTGVGTELYVGILDASCTNSQFEVKYLQQTSITGMKGFGRLGLTLTGYRPVNYILTVLVLWMRDEWESHPVRQARMKPLLVAVSHVQDTLLWRTVGLLSFVTEGSSVRAILALVVLRRLVMLLRRLTL